MAFRLTIITTICHRIHVPVCASPSALPDGAKGLALPRVTLYVYIGVKAAVVAAEVVP